MDGNQTARLSPAASSSSPAATAAGGFAIGIGALPRWAEAATVAAQPWDDERLQSARDRRLDRDRSGRFGPDPLSARRDGPGQHDGVPMMLNEELQADWSKVRIEYASANRNIRENKVYGDMFSNGSRSIKGSQKLVQQVGASARERLIAAAAARWNVPADECTPPNSVVTHTPSGRTLRYGELAADAAKIKLDKEPAIKTPDQFTFIGKPMPRIDVLHKIDGSAKFGIDAQVPGMVFAAIMQCPVPGGKLKSVDEAPLAGVPGDRPGGEAAATPSQSPRPAASGAPSRRSRSCSPSGMSAQPATPTARSSCANIARRSTTGKAATARNQGNVDQALPGGG